MAMPMMQLIVIQYRLWQFLSWPYCRYPFRIAFQQRIDQFDHLPRDTSHDWQFPLVASGSFIIGAFCLDQTLIEGGVLIGFQANGLSNNQKHHLFHGARATARQLCPIHRGSRLSDLRHPVKVRFQRCSTREIIN